MNRHWVRTGMTALLLITPLGCSTSTAPPALHSDVDLARTVWLAAHPQAYTFEWASQSSWVRKSGFYRIEVADGRVVTAVDSTGKAVPTLTLTLDSLWARLLTARAKGELNSAEFDAQGVPVETDLGPWPVDGGVHYWVRNFARRR